MSISQKDWADKWNKRWDITVCDPLCTVEDTDEIRLDATWEKAEEEMNEDILVSVAVKHWRNGNEIATLATGLTADAGGTKLSKTTSELTLTLTWQDATATEKAKLICTVEEPLTAIQAITFPNATSLFGQLIVLAARAAISLGEGLCRTGLALLRLVDEETDTGGQPGSWTAEDGGNRNAPRIAPPDTLIYARARRA